MRRWCRWGLAARSPPAALLVVAGDIDKMMRKEKNIIVQRRLPVLESGLVPLGPRRQITDGSSVGDCRWVA